MDVRPTFRRRQSEGRDPGPVVGHYRCWQCDDTWQATFPGLWALLDAAYRRDVCKACGATAAILEGYVPSLAPAAPTQLELDL